jgi:hypothetical protein
MPEAETPTPAQPPATELAETEPARFHVVQPADDLEPGESKTGFSGEDGDAAPRSWPPADSALPPADSAPADSAPGDASPPEPDSQAWLAGCSSVDDDLLPS